MTKTGRITIALGGLVLLVGLALVLLGSRPPPERTFKGSVKDLLPTADEVPGWTIEYLPIASTPEMKAKVAEALNYDDAIFAVYTRGPQRISAYVAYWAPGKMPHRFVASHTPDVCWVNAGWTTQAAQSGVRLSDGTGGKAMPAEERTMLRNGNTEHVVFWHLLNGKPMSYGTVGLPPWYATFTDLFARKLNQKPEQFFIRISSNAPVTEWSKMEVYRQLMGRLPING
jgi:hypothetical protein